MDPYYPYYHWHPLSYMHDVHVHAYTQGIIWYCFFFLLLLCIPKYSLYIATYIRCGVHGVEASATSSFTVENNFVFG